MRGCRTGSSRCVRGGMGGRGMSSAFSSLGARDGSTFVRDLGTFRTRGPGFLSGVIGGRLSEGC